jgi:hypothetical protein
MVRMPAGHLPSPPMEAARLFPEPAAGEPYTILIMVCTVYQAPIRWCIPGYYSTPMTIFCFM